MRIRIAQIKSVEFAARSHNSVQLGIHAFIEVLLQITKQFAAWIW